MGKVLCFSYYANLSNLKDLRFTTSCKMIFSVDVILFLQIIINEKWLNKRMHMASAFKILQFCMWQINKNRYGWAQIQVYFHSFVKKHPKYHCAILKSSQGLIVILLLFCLVLENTFRFCKTSSPYKTTFE